MPGATESYCHVGQPVRLNSICPLLSTYLSLSLLDPAVKDEQNKNPIMGVEENETEDPW
jgi:hypothetical protein